MRTVLYKYILCEGKENEIMKVIRSNLNFVVSFRLVMGLLALTIIIFLSQTKSLIEFFRHMALLSYGYHTDFILSALRSGTLAPFIPILAVLPFTANYIDNVKSRFARFFLIRTDYSAYLASHILVCFLSGGFVIVTGTLLAWGASALLFLPMEKAAETPSESATLLLKTCGLLFLNGGLWAVLGMTMSTIMESKYIAYASPFIVYYLLVILYERYFPNAWLLYPKNWLDPEIWPYGIGSAALFLLELTFLCGLVFYVRGKRRLEAL